MHQNYSMPRASNKPRIFFIGTLVIGISVLHYITKIEHAYFHDFYRELYFLPVILSGFWFGLKGGLITSLGISALYLPVIVMDWQSFSPDDFDRILETSLFNIVAIGLGSISDRRQKEEKARIEAERMARAEAESANRLKSDFLSIMSHELRTPLIGIIGYNDLLIDGVVGSLTGEQVDALRRIDKNSKKLLGLINDLLDLSRLEAEKVSVEIKEVCIPDLIEEIKSEAGSLAEKPKLNFIWKIEPGMPCLHTDPAKLKVVLKNLIGNALKFTDEGSVTVDARRHEQGVEISVTDTGIGIPSEMLPHIFDLFRQAESPLTRSHEGAGLGLYISKRLIELLGGRIEVESKIGRGSIFRVRIPCSKHRTIYNIN